MIKNVRIKRFLVNYIFPVFSLTNKLIKKDDNSIFIYCANGELNDNSEAIYNYLITNEYNKKYRIICGGANMDKIQELPPNVSFISKRRCVMQYMKSGHIFYSMGKIPIKPSDKQIVINMWHGIPIKKIGKMSNIGNGEEFFFTYVCAPSKIFVPIMAQSFGCPEKNVLICGEAKADKLFMPKVNRNNKLIVWAPTFKQSKFLGYDDSSNSSIVPLFDEKEWKELNKYLKQNKVDLIVKLHPMQDVDKGLKTKYSNLEIYCDAEFKNENKDIFWLMSQADGLITDYSGVYIDYLLLNRPICFALSDIEEYSNRRGFVFDNPLDYMPGKKAYCKDDIYAFIKEIADGQDLYEDDRNKINAVFNHYKDGENCKRLLEFSKIKKL